MSTPLTHKLALWTEVLDYLTALKARVFRDPTQRQDYKQKEAYADSLDGLSALAIRLARMGYQDDGHGIPISVLYDWGRDERLLLAENDETIPDNDMELDDMLNAFTISVKTEMRKELMQLTFVAREEMEALGDFEQRLAAQSE